MTTAHREEAGPIGAGAPSSRQRAWWPVHQFIEAVVRQASHGSIPAAGTPSWCALSDGDPRKLLAVAIDGEHHVLRIEVAQEQRGQAAKAIAAAADWPAISRSIGRRNTVHIPRRTA